MFFSIIFYSFMFAGEFLGAITTSFMRPLVPRTNENEISLHIMSNLGYNTPNHFSSFADVVALRPHSRGSTAQTNISARSKCALWARAKCAPTPCPSAPTVGARAQSNLCPKKQEARQAARCCKPPPDGASRRQMVQATASPPLHREGASMPDSPPTPPQQVEDVKNTGTGVGIPEWKREVLGARLSFSLLSPSLLFSCGDVWA